MNTPHEIDQGLEKQFMQFHQAWVKAYEEEVKRAKEKIARQEERQRADEKEMRAMLKNAGIDVDLLDRRGQRDQKELKTMLGQVRPGLVERPNRRITDFKERSWSAGSVLVPGRHMVPAYGVSGISVDRNDLAGNKGDFNGPWIFPADPGQVKIMRSDTGDGWGCGAHGETPPPKITSWFYFVPDTTASWNLTMVITFHGFYIVKADDGLFTCKSAEVHTDVKMDVYQYYWHGPKNFSLIDIGSDNIDVSGNYDATQNFSYPIDLKAGDLVWVTVETSVDAFAVGDGSYAEMNYSDGNANYIEPLYLSAWVV